MSKIIDKIKEVLDAGEVDEYFWTEGIAQEIVKKLQEQWEEEFEDEINYNNSDTSSFEWIELTKKDLVALVEKYLLEGHEFHQKVKIKARKGKIVIEKVEE